MGQQPNPSLPTAGLRLATLSSSSHWPAMPGLQPSSTMPPNRSLHPKCYGGLRRLAQSGELKRWAVKSIALTQEALR